jgi:hypothetical protein
MKKVPVVSVVEPYVCTLHIAWSSADCALRIADCSNWCGISKM